MSLLFVVVALLLNGATYTEIRGAGGGSLDAPAAALGVHADATSGTAALLRSVNANDTTSYGTLRTTLDRAVGSWSDLRDRHAATRGGAVGLALNDTTNGTAIRQDDPDRNLTSVGHLDNWTLATGVTAVRDWHLDVDRASLVAPASTSTSGLQNASVFRVVVDDAAGGETSRAFLYREGTANVTVAVGNSTGIVGTCSADAGGDGRLSVDLTAATVAGRSCGALATIGFDGQVDVAHELGSNARARYALDVDVPRSAIDDSVYGATGSETAPFVRRLLYDATVRIRYASPALSYTSAVTVGGGADA